MLDGEVWLTSHSDPRKKDSLDSDGYVNSVGFFFFTNMRVCARSVTKMEMYVSSRKNIRICINSLPNMRICVCSATNMRTCNSYVTQHCYNSLSNCLVKLLTVILWNQKVYCADLSCRAV